MPLFFVWVALQLQSNEKLFEGCHEGWHTATSNLAPDFIPGCGRLQPSASFMCHFPGSRLMSFRHHQPSPPPEPTNFPADSEQPWTGPLNQGRTIPKEPWALTFLKHFRWEIESQTRCKLRGLMLSILTTHINSGKYNTNPRRPVSTNKGK